MDWLDVLTIALLIGLATCVQGAVGFGFAMVFAPLAALFISAQTAIATSILAGALVAGTQYAEYRPRAPLRSIAPLVLAAVAGIPIGLALLASAGDSTLQLLVGVAVLASALIIMTQRSSSDVRRPERLPAMLGAGLTGGITLGAVSMNGPPVLLYQHWVGGGSVEIRSRMFGFLVFSSAIGVVLAAVAGIIDRDVLIFALAGLPTLGAGIFAGRYIRPRLSELWFARASMGLLFLASAAAIGGAAEALLA